LKTGEILAFLDGLSPFELQESWDNSGLLVGDESEEVERIVVSVDIDEAMIDAAPPKTLFILHHPLIFGKLRRLVWREYPANLLRELIRNEQSLVAMHTNFDQTHLNRYVFEKVLGFTLKEEVPFICRAEGRWNYHELLALLKEKLDLPPLEDIRLGGYVLSCEYKHARL
jgi:putative NIF3 family GTP cyclohydrolase 1 type 2